MTNRLPAAVAALTFLIVPLAASAEPGNGNGNGRGHAVVSESGAFCPPGLARRDPACVPPGQARRALTEAERAERREERRAERQAERRAEAERDAEAERIAQVRAERRAARLEADRLAIARAEADPDVQARAEEDGRSDDEMSRAAQILTALLTPPTQGSAPSTAPQALPLQQTSTVTPAPAAQPSMGLTEALAQAAATGAFGY